MRYVRLPLAILAVIAISACGGGKTSSNGGSTAGSSAGSAAGTTDGGAMTSGTAARMPDCGAVRPVWVNLRTRKYHEQGDPAYGNTKHGEYLCPAQARQQGFVRAGAGGAGHHRHRRRAESAGDQSDDGQSGQNATDNP